jgi:hypothetical protein
MCQSFREPDKKKVIGYKVVAIDDNGKPRRYRSLLTGNLYPLKGKMPIWKSQKYSLAHFVRIFGPKKSKYFRSAMTGRTSVFVRLEDAEEYLHGFSCYMTATCTWGPSGFSFSWDTRDFAVVKAELSDGLLAARSFPVKLQNGKQRPGRKTYVGRKLKVLEVVLQSTI